MSEQPPLTATQQSSRAKRAADITGNALRNTAHDPGFHQQLRHAGAAVLEASGIVRTSARGHRRLSISGTGRAVTHPKEAFGEAMGGMAAELGPLAAYAGITLVSKLAAVVLNGGPNVQNNDAPIPIDQGYGPEPAIPTNVPERQSRAA